MFDIKVKAKVLKMRRMGRSLEEIRSLTRISKGTLSLWLKGVVLSEKAKTRLLHRQVVGNKKVAAILKQKKALRISDAQMKAAATLSRLSVASQEQDMLTCALIYYCEGAKSDQRMSFTNSDPDLMRVFLTLLRRVFTLDESRFRVQMHLHSYHNEKTQKAFWAKVSGIPEDNFIKSFQKEEGGVFKKEGYPGCVTVRYHDVSVARELLETARKYFKISA